jgi:hypothetical protein
MKISHYTELLYLLNNFYQFRAKWFMASASIISSFPFYANNHATTLNPPEAAAVDGGFSHPIQRSTFFDVDYGTRRGFWFLTFFRFPWCRVLTMLAIRILSVMIAINRVGQLNPYSRVEILILISMRIWPTIQIYKSTFDFDEFYPLFKLCTNL